MAKISSNGHVKVAWILEADLTNPEAPSAAELNTDGFDLSQAIAWENYEVGATESNTIEDRALTDVGNAVTRGNAQFSASLSFFRDADLDDVTSVYNTAFTLFRTELTDGYIVTRVGPDAEDAFVANDVVSVFKFQAGATSDDTPEEGGVKFVVEFLPQGALWVNTRVATAVPVIATPATAAPDPGDIIQLVATLSGETITHSATYTVDDSSIGTVSGNGVVTISGTASPADVLTVTVDHPAATAPDTVVITIATP